MFKGRNVIEDFEHLLFVIDYASMSLVPHDCLMSFIDTKWACAFIILPILVQKPGVRSTNCVG